MKQGSTLFLRAAITLIGLIVLALCVLTLPYTMDRGNDAGYRSILFGMYVTVIPFYFALYRALNLLGYIDKNNAFSDLSVKALNHIKFCAVIIGALYTASMPYIYFLSSEDSALVVIGAIFIFASSVIAVLAAVLQKLLQNAIDLKSENDLTV